MNKITLCVALMTLCFSIALADASQQAMLRVQWQQLSLQSDYLTTEEKLTRVQDLSLLVDVSVHNTTQLTRSTADVLETGNASQAELALTKWLMLVNLGESAEQYRLIYLQDQISSQNQVWLAKYDQQDVTLMTIDKILPQTESRELMQQKKIISVINPKEIMSARVGSRKSHSRKQQSYYL